MEEKSINLWCNVWVFKGRNGHRKCDRMLWKCATANMFMAKEAMTSGSFQRAESDKDSVIKKQQVEINGAGAEKICRVFR